MQERSAVLLVLALGLQASIADAQWADPKLIAGQVGFHVTSSFVGKLVFERQPVGRALKQALREGAAAGLVAHAGYTLAGRDPRLALPGKLLVQKSALMTRRSIHCEGVFDRSLYRDWALTHGALHFRLQDLHPEVELDVVNAAFAARFLLAGDGYHLDAGRSLLTGSFVFRNENPPPGINGFHMPGVIWVDAAQYDDTRILEHEVIHSLQAERGAAIFDWHSHGLRFNPLVFASGVPAFLEGWPSHDRRLHELEAHLYAGR